MLALSVNAMLAPSASAGTVRIEQSTERSVAVIADGATLSEVVGKLGETYGFRLDLKGASKVGAAPRGEQQTGDRLYLDGRFEGTVRAVLERLLAHESYFIEHSSGSKSGIARVVIYNLRSSQVPAA
jgi:hypothetical protein